MPNILTYIALTLLLVFTIMRKSYLELIEIEKKQNTFKTFLNVFDKYSILQYCIAILIIVQYFILVYIKENVITVLLLALLSLVLFFFSLPFKNYKRYKKTLSKTFLLYYSIIDILIYLTIFIVSLVFFNEYILYIATAIYLLFYDSLYIVKNQFYKIYFYYEYTLYSRKIVETNIFNEKKVIIIDDFDFSDTFFKNISDILKNTKNVALFDNKYLDIKSFYYDLEYSLKSNILIIKNSKIYKYLFKEKNILFITDNKNSLHKNKYILNIYETASDVKYDIVNKNIQSIDLKYYYKKREFNSTIFALDSININLSTHILSILLYNNIINDIDKFIISPDILEGSVSIEENDIIINFMNEFKNFNKSNIFQNLFLNEKIYKILIIDKLKINFNNDDILKIGNYFNHVYIYEKLHKKSVFIDFLKQCSKIKKCEISQSLEQIWASISNLNQVDSKAVIIF